MAVMSILPKTKDRWVAFMLLPFKAWVLVGLPFALLFRYCYPSLASSFVMRELYHWIAVGYVLSIAALFLGAIIQGFFMRWAEAVTTALYAIMGMLWVWAFPVL